MPFDVLAFLQDHTQLASELTLEVLEGGYWNQVYRVRSEGIDWVVKCFYEEQKRARLYPVLPDSEALALKVLSQTKLVPEFVDYIPKRQTNPAVLIYQYVPGELWQGDISAVAKLLKRLHQCDVTKQDFRSLAMTPQAILEQADSLLADCQQDDLVTYTKTLRPNIKTLTSLENRCLVHTDAWLGNFIGTQDRLVLIDWQCPGLGDAAEDVWTFLYSGYQQLIGHSLYSKAQQESFLKAYSDKAMLERLQVLSPYFAYRVAAHAVMRIQDLKTINPKASQRYKKILASLREQLL